MDLSYETRNANQAKNLTLDKLFEDKIINEDEKTIYQKNWKMIIVKKGWFNKLISKDEDASWFFKLVKFNFNDDAYESIKELKL